MLPGKMPVTETTAKTILRKFKRPDSWFACRYSMNLYRGCQHNCIYCDGRHEKYHVSGEFGRDVQVKLNAAQVLDRELNPARKRKPLKPGYILLGGGVNDSYQPAEEKYCLSRQALELIVQYDFPVHILTKSTLVERDLDLLLRINKSRRAIVSMSFSSVDDALSAFCEPGVPPPSTRLACLTRLKRAGLACGMYLLPVLPNLSDTPAQLQRSVQAARAAGLDFIVFGGLTLKAGRQQEYFYDALGHRDPELLHEYEILYYGHPYGQPRDQYTQSLHSLLYTITRRYGLPCRIPPRLYTDLVDENDRVCLMLEHLDYYYKLEGRQSPFGYAAYVLSRQPGPLREQKHSLPQLKGIGPVTARLVREILATGRLQVLEDYLRGGK